MTRLAFRVVANAVIVFQLCTPLFAAAQTAQDTVVSFQYDAQGNLKQVTDPRLVITNYEYDSANRRRKTIQPPPVVGAARPVVGFDYDGLDQLSTVTDPRNLTTTYTVDGLGNQTTLASPDTGASGQTFDSEGNVTTSTDARGKVTTYIYDALNRVKSIRYVTGVASVFEYDGGPNGPVSAIGQLSKLTDESGQTTYGFDAGGRLELKVQTTGTMNFSTKYTYGTEGTSLGKVTSITYPSGNRVNYGYDIAGTVVTMTLNRGLPGGTTDTGTAVPLLTNITYAPFGTVQSWDWGNHTVAQPNRYSRTFDLDGRIKTYPLGNVGGAPLDLTASVTAVPSVLTFNSTTGVYSGTLTLTNTASLATTGQLEVLFRNLPAGVTLVSPSGTRDGAPFKLINSITPAAQYTLPVQFKNTGSSAITYASRVMSRASIGMTRTLGYDAASRIKTMAHGGVGFYAAMNQTFGYDDLDRLRTFAGNNNNHVYDYDATGNRSKTVIGASTYTLTTSPTSNQLASTTGPYPAKNAVAYAAGSILGDGTTAYTYSDRGRMKRAVKGGVTTDYQYNALGQRVSKNQVTATTFTNYYVYDEQGQLMGEYQGDGKPIQETVYLDGMPVAVLAGAVYYVYADHINTARVITSSVDNVPVWRWDKADPFGAQLPEMNPNGRGVFTYNPRFPGQLFDKETNNHYNYFRDYDPQTGRYVQSDPIGLAGGLNTYAYVGSNPITRSDPKGLCVGPFAVACWHVARHTTGLLIAAEFTAVAATGAHLASNPIAIGGRAAGAAINHVYIGMRQGKPVYVGITNELSRRTCEHGKRFDAYWRVTSAPVTRDQARSIEQQFLNANRGQFENEINSIASTRTWYAEGLEWAAEWGKRNGFGE
jgi:RHS repeat-associated protein